YGEPTLDGSIDRLRDAGGAVGVLVAAPLTAATGVVGAGVILGALALLGALLALGLSIRGVATAALRGARRATGVARARLDMGEIGAADHDDVAPDPEAEPEPAPEP